MDVTKPLRDFSRNSSSTGGLKGSYARGVTDGEAVTELTDLRKANLLIKRKAVPTDLGVPLSC